MGGSNRLGGAAADCNKAIAQYDDVKRRVNDAVDAWMSGKLLRRHEMPGVAQMFDRFAQAAQQEKERMAAEESAAEERRERRRRQRVAAMERKRQQAQDAQQMFMEGF